jgi:hypothetical protein
MKKGTKRLSGKELKRLKDVLDWFERYETRATGVGYISGGFAEADMFNYDDEFIDIKLKWGVQSDCENHTTTEQYKLSREILNNKKLTAQQKAQRID